MTWPLPAPVPAPPGGDDVPRAHGSLPNRLHPLTPLAVAGRALWLVVVVTVLGTIEGRAGNADAPGAGSGNGDSLTVTVAVLAVMVVLLVASGVVSYLVTRYEVSVAELRVDRGLVRRQSARVRLSRLQSVDVLQPFAARLLGLAEVRVTTAGTERDTVRLRYLGRADAQALRAELLARGAGVQPDAGEAPERPLAVVPPGTLVGAVLLQAVSWRLLLVLAWSTVALVGAAERTGGSTSVLDGLAGTGFTALLLIGHSLWRQISGLWMFTVAESPDGIRVRHGLLSTSAQTIPYHRVQALRIHQPALWRPFGWAAVRINVAGYAGKRETHNTVMIPVAPRAFAEWLVSRVVGDDVTAVPLSRPPARARWRAPVWWSYQWAGSDERVFVARQGVLTRSTEVVPHQRTQSVHLSAGPWQRALGLASLHLDSTRGPVRCRAAHRDAAEARAMLDLQADRARRARQWEAAPPVPAPPLVAPPIAVPPTAGA